MKLEDIKKTIKHVWDWIWNSDSILSWIVALFIIFVFVKFVFFPVLSLITGSSLPIAGVESSSMEHQIVPDATGILMLCGKPVSEEKEEHINFDEYWNFCGDWYEDNGISKEEFSEFPLRNGFSKGDIILVWGRFTPEVGDIIIFKPNTESTAPRPIIHRIIKIENGIISTKGDHNARQLTIGNNLYHTDETKIYPEQVIGKATVRIPYLGWVKIWATEIIKIIFR
jgi:signal peptidase I